MKKINFEAGTQVSPAKVTIDNVEHNVTPAVWEGKTPLSPFVLNKMQDNIENATKTTKTTDISEELTVEDASPVSGRLSINGKTEQETRSGKNKLNLVKFNGKTETKNGVTYRVNKDGSITFKGTATGYTSWLIEEISLSAGSYKLSGGSKDCFVQFTTNFKETIDDIEKSLVLDTDTNSNMYFVCNKAGTYNITIYPMIRLATETDNTYEPYGVSPSPDFPSRIRNVGDNINIFDSSKNSYIVKDASYVLNNKNKITITNSNIWCRVGCTISNLKPNTKYIISTDVINTSGVKCGLYEKESNYNISSNKSFKSKITVTTDNTGTLSLSQLFYSNFSETYSSATVIYDNIQLKEGTVATGCSPYGCGCVGLKGEGKNKIKLNNLENTTKNRITYSIKDGVITLNGTATSGFMIIFNESRYTLKPETYTFSSNFEGNVRGIVGQYIYEYNNTNNIIINYGGIEEKPKTKNITSSIEVMYGIWVNSGAILNNVKLKPQLELGSNSTSFQKHYKEQNKVFPLSKGQVLHKGDYLADNGIHQNRSTYVFTGNEKVSVTEFDKTTRVVISNVLNPKGKSASTDVLCNITKSAIMWDEDIEGIYVNGGDVVIRIDKTKLPATESAVREFLASGVYIDYRLAEEIVIPYTEEQKQAYFELQHLQMYEGYTHITCIDEIKPDMQLTYYFNNEINKTYGARFDENERKINELEKGEIYSIEEQVIGKWIDGKPIYRKVFTGSTGNTLMGKVITKNVDTLIDAKGELETTTGVKFFITSSPITTAITQACRIVNVNNDIRLDMTSEFLNKPYKVILEYTKITD